MKRNSITHRITHALIVWCLCAGGTAWVSEARAQGDRATDSGTSSAQRKSSTADRAGVDTEKVRVTRASNYLGSDVIATDCRKVGDIVDYYFNLGGAPHLEYIVVMTGGFLDLGGDRRAVPASAITISGDSCRIDVSSDRFWDVPVLPENHARFLSERQNRQRLSQFFSPSNRTAGADSARSSAAPSGRSQEAATGERTAASSAGGEHDDPNRAGAMTGRARAQGESRLVSFSELRNADAYGQQDTRLGYFADAWINLNDNRAPYVEVTPTFQIFRTNFDRRYAIPTAKLAQSRESYGYTVNVTSEDLNEAETVTEAEGVRMLEEGRFGDNVLRVTVPEK